EVDLLSGDGLQRIARWAHSPAHHVPRHDAIEQPGDGGIGEVVREEDLFLQSPANTMSRVEEEGHTFLVLASIITPGAGCILDVGVRRRRGRQEAHVVGGRREEESNRLQRYVERALLPLLDEERGNVRGRLRTGRSLGETVEPGLCRRLAGSAGQVPVVTDSN